MAGESDSLEDFWVGGRGSVKTVSTAIGHMPLYPSTVEVTRLTEHSVRVAFAADTVYATQPHISPPEGALVTTAVNL